MYFCFYSSITSSYRILIIIQLFFHINQGLYIKNIHRAITGYATSLTFTNKLYYAISVKRIIPVFLALVLLFSATQSVLARHRNRVLGASTQASELNFPSISSGPGLILPDSPFYFVDKLKQQVRLLLAFSPEDKAKLRADIAGERLAELKAELLKNNQKGINIALSELASETQKAATALTDAEQKGKDVSLLSQQINEKIKTERDILKGLEKQADGELKLRIELTQATVKKAKVEVEDSLPQNIMENEIRDSINSELEDKIKDAQDVSQGIKNSLEELSKEASDAAQKSLTRREEALKKAIEEKNAELVKEQKDLLEQEAIKQATLIGITLKAARGALQAAEELEKISNAFYESEKDVEEIRAIPVPKPTPAQTLLNSNQVKL